MPDRRFTDLLTDYQTALHSGHADIAADAAARLPLDALREEHRAGIAPLIITLGWAASVADTARELRELMVIHDNGGTSSSIKKIKRAARELLRLLGED